MNKGCLLGLGLFLLVITAGLGYYFMQKDGGDTKGIETTQPTITSIVKKTIATGSIKPRKEVLIKPQVSGVVDILYVEAGALVKKGERLAKIKLVPSQVNINNAQSGVELARIRYKEAQRELARQREVFDKQLDVENARINFENAKKEETRQQELYSNGVISELAYNQYKIDLELRKAALENARILAQANLKQFEAEVDIRKQELEASINNLQLLQEGATKNSKQVSNIVVSTVEGMVLDIPVEEGYSVIERNNFNEGTTIAAVADMNSLIFEGLVDESDVGKLRLGMPLELTVGAIENEKFDAQLEYISPKGVIEEGTVKFEVRAAIQSTSETFLRAGYSASGDIILDKKEGVVAINERDLIISNDTTFVEIKAQNGRFEKRQINVGLSDGILIEVKNGVDTSTIVKVQKKI